MPTPLVHAVPSLSSMLTDNFVGFQQKTVLVTGAAGFIGSYVAQRLCTLGASVIGVDNFNPYYAVELKKQRWNRLSSIANFQGISLDLADPTATLLLFTEHKPHLVIHLAAQPGVRYSLVNPQAYAQANLNGFLNVLEGCRQQAIGHLVYASSSSIYGVNQTLPFQETARVDHPVSLYAATKRANELMAHSYSHLFQIPTTGLRFFTVYGPWGRPDMTPVMFTRAILEGRTIQVYNQGHMQRDFTYIDDIVEGAIRALALPPAPCPESGAPYALYNIGGHRAVALETFIQTIERYTGCTARKEYLPMQAGDMEATYADTSALKAATGFSPETSLEIGLPKTIDWVRSYYGYIS